MTIKGLTDRGLAFPEIGKIRKGDRGGKNGAPRDLSYFRVEFDEQEKDAAALFLKRYGPQPTEINVILPFNEIERMWDPYLEAYTAGRMVARSDNERYLYLLDTKTGKPLVQNGEPYRAYKPGEVVGTYTNSKTGKVEEIRCKPAGRLKVIVPELGRAAYLTALTGSIHDVVNISDQLRAFAAVNGGRLSGIPLVLRRRPHEVSVPKPDGSRVRLKKWLLSIEADPKWVKRLLIESRRLALPGGPDVKLLESPADERVIETGFVEDETGEDDYYDGAEQEAGEQEQSAAAAQTAAPAAQNQAASAPQATDPTQHAPAAGPAPQVPGNGQARPYPPEYLRSKIATTAKKHEDKSATQSQISLCAYVLSNCWPGDKHADQKRHMVQHYLTGYQSLGAMPGAQVLALLDWLNAKKDAAGDYWADEMSAREAGGVLRDAMKAAGQGELPF